MDKTYLIFAYRGAHYALASDTVREMVWLPELSPLEEVPPNVVGAFNLRGQVIPVLDLALCFGHPPSRPGVSDAVIVIAIGGSAIGIVANELVDATSIAPAAIEDARNFQEPLGAPAHFVSGVARLEHGLAMVLDIRALLQCAPERPALVTEEAAPGGEALPGFTPRTAQDSEVFRERAEAIAHAPDDAARTHTSSFAIIRLDSELFAMGMDFVREFAHLRSAWPVPCCPPHIVGNMNFRGDILTVLDLRPVLGLATPDSLREVVVIRAGPILMGVAATEIVDVVHLDPAGIAPPPPVGDGADRPYCGGIARLGEQAFSIIDIGGILATRVLHVAEEVR